MSSPSWCALEARVEALQLKLDEYETLVNEGFIAFKDFTEAQVKNNNYVQQAIDELDNALNDLITFKDRM